MAAEAKTNAGSKLYICVTPKNEELTETQLKALQYVQVKKVGSVGGRGINTNIVTYDTWDTLVALKATARDAVAALRCSLGSTPVASRRRASSRASLASLALARLTSGYRPSASSFSLPATRCFQRQLLAPTTVIKRNRPPPSISFWGLSAGTGSTNGSVG